MSQFLIALAVVVVVCSGAAVFALARALHMRSVRQARSMSDEQLDVEIYWAASYGESKSVYHDERDRRIKLRDRVHQ